MTDFRDDDNNVIFKAGVGSVFGEGVSLRRSWPYFPYLGKHSNGALPVWIPILPSGVGTWRSHVKAVCHNVTKAREYQQYGQEA